ncbi:MAG TPA: sigma-70 family RNA polymerase sigma factor [Chitinophaga sp.]|uniref:RNA polymerase sigma factor n=1 Tax=Chitinophaga sp. TaxID=1869181 RepID=UPI002D0EBA8A|nr:sigma-70 family RNA polymerase sigma factor [Chitinophaga sp.]HVI45718.1 sigma-70 family RNA polymerase sigma factor [Chitinophaga sp.]
MNLSSIFKDRELEKRYPQCVSLRRLPADGMLTMHNNNDEEQALFQRIAEGDEDAFGRLFHAMLHILAPFVQKIVKSEEDAREVIQTTFLRVWLNRDKLPEIEHPRAWLFRVASNECYTYLRKEATEQRLRTNAAGAATIAPTQEISIKEIHHIIAEAVAGLSPQRRRIYQMSRNQGMKIPEIANALQLSPHTVKNALVFSLRSIRTHLERCGYGIPLVWLIMIYR